MPDELEPGEDSFLERLEGLISELIRGRAQERFKREKLASEEEEKFRRLLLQLLDLSDAHERILANIGEKEARADPQTRAWVGNFRAAYRRLQRLLKDWGVEPVQGAGVQADPQVHRVVETEVRPGQPDGLIVDEVRRGYLWAGKLLRAAEVVTVKNDAT